MNKKVMILSMVLITLLSSIFGYNYAKKLKSQKFVKSTIEIRPFARGRKGHIVVLNASWAARTLRAINDSNIQFQYLWNGDILDTIHLVSADKPNAGEVHRKLTKSLNTKYINKAKDFNLRTGEQFFLIKNFENNPPVQFLVLPHTTSKKIPVISYVILFFIGGLSISALLAINLKKFFKF